MSSRSPYLDPESVPPEVRRIVLERLNAARTPEEIAAAIEYPGELDIGVRLATRLLRARDEIGGFTDLAQVRGVRLIGPERFTEIVSALSGQPRPPDPFEQLRQEVDALRRLVGATHGNGTLPRRRLAVTPVRPHFYLGQPISLTAVLTENGAPVVDVPVTFVATRGALRASDGYQTQSGHLVTVRTGIDGVVRITALPTTTEPMTPLQQDALSAGLALLEPDAATPADAAAGLRALADRYAWEVNLPLRQAIDIFVREFRPMLLDTVNVRDHLFAWPTSDSAVLGFAPIEGNGDSGSSVAATASLHLRANDWIPAFLETFVDSAREQSSLASELREIGTTEDDPARIINGIYTRAGEYIATRWGNVGAYVGRKVAESSIRGFLETDGEQLPLDTRVALFPALTTASRTVASTDTAVIGAIVGTRREISAVVDRKTGQLPGEVGGLFDRLEVMESEIARIPAERTAALDAALAQHVTRAELNAAIADNITRAELDIALADNVTRAELDNALADNVTRAELDNALADNVTRAELDGVRVAMDERIGRVTTNIGRLDTRITNLGR